MEIICTSHTLCSCFTISIRNKFPGLNRSQTNFERLLYIPKKGVIKNLMNKGYHLAILLGENPDKDGDLFLLNCRWLRYSNIHLDLNDQQYLWNRMGDRLDMKRKGGSNGIVSSLNWYKFLKA